MTSHSRLAEYRAFIASRAAGLTVADVAMLALLRRRK